MKLSLVNPDLIFITVFPLLSAYLILLSAYLILLSAYLILLSAYLILLSAYLILLSAYLILLFVSQNLWTQTSLLSFPFHCFYYKLQLQYYLHLWYQYLQRVNGCFLLIAVFFIGLVLGFYNYYLLSLFWQNHLSLSEKNQSWRVS